MMLGAISYAKAGGGMLDTQSNPCVTILLATYNGERFLEEQLDSYAAQSHQNWRLVVSDDGSTDGTMRILKNYQAKWGSSRMEIRTGPRVNFRKNFLSMMCDPSIRSDFYAFSDQDDVWLPEKLAVAVAFLSQQDDAMPHVYGGRTIYTDEKLNEIGLSPEFCYPRSFRNALVQSIAGGNTMVFNGAAKELLERAGVRQIISHDWWVYQLVEGFGGRVHFDLTPYILYRQHPGALVGANTSLRAVLVRFLMLIQGKFKEWNTINTSSLLEVEHLLLPHNVDIIREFLRLRDGHIIERIRMIGVCGLFRQGWHGNLSLLVAVFLKKI
jgi:glycosyltransferase involved in cell wall biosynthesis